TLRYFVEVVRQQSFTRAAEKLFVTQPTISKMLKNLEDELNCTNERTDELFKLTVSAETQNEQANKKATITERIIILLLTGNSL
ncbi:LysR family transcriptional regulator, partial [Salmonella enterica subsp. enterica serovar Kentucky]|nr:LysR family transcriptional regulator [Salmonella enterica subsp. enterica serovar Kentucky]